MTDLKISDSLLGTRVLGSYYPDNPNTSYVCFKKEHYEGCIVAVFATKDSVYTIVKTTDGCFRESLLSDLKVI